MVEMLSNLRAPPKVGRRYIVPAVDYIYCGRRSVWPVFGPLHHDRGVVGFPAVHLHIDPRFVSGDQARYLRGYGESVEACAAYYPVCYRGEKTPPKPSLVEMRCRVSSWEYAPPSRPPWLGEFDRIYGEIAQAVRVKGGRVLCPHRKADLSSLPIGADGTVKCPLHGLRVQCREIAA